MQRCNEQRELLVIDKAEKTPTGNRGPGKARRLVMNGRLSREPGCGILAVTNRRRIKGCARVRPECLSALLLVP